MLEKLKDYARLMRFDKPVGTFLLLWPTLWALWLASDGKPSFFIVVIFVVGVVLMRAAGCIINDIVDRDFDKHVQRTRHRPLAAEKISVFAAWVLFAIILGSAFLLVLSLNFFTILLAVIGAVLAIIYPTLKRFTHLPQLGLGVAFAWGVPMAFAAELDRIPSAGWVVFLAAFLWPIIYDTMYAMVDRDDDLKIGVKSTAILFGQHDKNVLIFLQILFFLVLIAIGYLFNLSYFYYLSLLIVAGLQIYQQILIRHRDREACFKAFVDNQWVGFFVFTGIILSKSL